MRMFIIPVYQEILLTILSNIELYWKVIWNIIFYTSVNIIYKEVSGNSFIKGKLFEYNFIMKIFWKFILCRMGESFKICAIY